MLPDLASPAREIRPTVLVVDDELGVRASLRKILEDDCEILEAIDAASALAVMRQREVDMVLLDMMLPDALGTDVLGQIKALDESIEVILVTAVREVRTAVEAIKLGATHYLAKPADADEILAAFHRTEGDAALPVGPKPLSVARLEWEHIQKVLSECQGNISETARRLGMHRRTLQRKLGKRPARS